MKLLTYRSVMEMLDCSRSGVRKLVKDGRLAPPAIYNGLGPRFREEDVLTYIVLKGAVPKAPEAAKRNRQPPRIFP
jgi:hypothetical protein